MGTLYLVRHGQASFGADDYDQLSPLGLQQCQRLGAYFSERGLQFEAVWMGSLKRHRQSWEGIHHGLGEPALSPLVWPGLNEYDSQAVIHCVHPEPLAKPDTPERYKHHFGLLRQGLYAWMSGQTQPQGMPSFKDFVQGIQDALAHVRSQHSGKVLMVSSGGPISIAIGRLLGAPPESMVELNMRIRNTSVSELVFTPKRYSLLSFNTINHLDAPLFRDWVTYT
ncbi:MAG: histidine phosphatase family protein [Betaproteobacteria bacterium]|nr:histidine phosphatase family protein [Betaproteobacteria bacterium]